jgi:branched-chain amino acid transport system substrate-binding protein
VGAQPKTNFGSCSNSPLPNPPHKGEGIFSAPAATFLLLLLTTSPAHAEINIAAVGPITGQDATTGEQMQRGAEAAVEAINAQGGVLGQKLRLIIKDDACDPKQAVAIANELSGEDTFAVIGHMCSGSAIPASKVYNEEGIIAISPSATSPLLTEQGFDNIFRTCGRDDQQGDTVAHFISLKYPGKNVAIVQDKTAYGQGLADQVQKTLHNLGITEKMYESTNRGERDYSSLLSKLKDNHIDVLFYGGYHTEAGLIVRQMRDQGMRTVFIGDDDLTTREFWSITGDAGENAFMSFNSDPRTKPEAADAVKYMRAKGLDPEGSTLYSYAAVQIVAEAIRRAGVMDIKKTIAAMHEGSYATVIGDISFDTKGDVTKPDYIIYRWTKGAYSPVEE